MGFKGSGFYNNKKVFFFYLFYFSQREIVSFFLNLRFFKKIFLDFRTLHPSYHLSVNRNWGCLVLFFCLKNFFSAVAPACLYIRLYYIIFYLLNVFVFFLFFFLYFIYPLRIYPENVVYWGFS